MRSILRQGCSQPGSCKGPDRLCHWTCSQTSTSTRRVALFCGASEATVGKLYGDSKPMSEGLWVPSYKLICTDEGTCDIKNGSRHRKLESGTTRRFRLCCGKRPGRTTRRGPLTGRRVPLSDTLRPSTLHCADNLGRTQISWRYRLHMLENPTVPTSLADGHDRPRSYFAWNPIFKQG